MAIRNPNLDEEIIGYDTLQTNEVNRVGNFVASTGITQLRLLTGTCTADSTTVTFPAGWNNSVVLSVEAKNANNVWITINARYASNIGNSFYFTHDAVFSGLEYRVYILKTQNLV